MELVQVIVLVLVMIMIIYFIIWMFTKSTQLTNTMDATVPQTILAKTLPMNSNSNNYTYSTWFIINDWNYHFGQEKVLLQRVDKNNNSSPTITLGGKTNDVTVKISCYNTGASAAGLSASAMSLSATGLSDADIEDAEETDVGTTLASLINYTKELFGTNLTTKCYDIVDKDKRLKCMKCQVVQGTYNKTDNECSELLNKYDDVIGADFYPNLKNCADTYLPPATPATGAGTATGATANTLDPNKAKFNICVNCALSEGTFSTTLGTCTELVAPPPINPTVLQSPGVGNSSSVTHECKVDNIPLQKWVNLLVSVYNRTLDIYLDGKLVRTCVLPGVPMVNSTADILVTPQNADNSPGGFVGFTTNFQYWPSASNPQQAYDIYKNGLGGSILSNIINKFRIKVAFLKDNKETGSFVI
jgi:hypothetical protein